MPFQMVQVSKLYQQVAEQIARLIELGELQVGDRLPPERELSARLGVSRPTVREAMIALEISGLVEVRTGSGVYITDNTAAKNIKLDGLVDAGVSPLDLIDTRLVVECAIAAKSAKHATPEHLDAAEKAISDMVEADERTAYQMADRAFHLELAKASGNSVLASIVEALWAEMNSPMFTRYSSISGLASENEPPTIAEHRAILAAVRSGDPELEEATMRRHLVNVRTYLRRDWKAEGDESAG